MTESLTPAGITDLIPSLRAGQRASLSSHLSLGFCRPALMSIFLRPLQGLGLLLEAVWKSDQRLRFHYT